MTLKDRVDAIQEEYKTVLLHAAYGSFVQDTQLLADEIAEVANQKASANLDVEAEQACLPRGLLSDGVRAS
jgi:hypothetical protein